MKFPHCSASRFFFFFFTKYCMWSVLINVILRLKLSIFSCYLSSFSSRARFPVMQRSMPSFYAHNKLKYRSLPIRNILIPSPCPPYHLCSTTVLLVNKLFGHTVKAFKSFHQRVFYLLAFLSSFLFTRTDVAIFFYKRQTTLMYCYGWIWIFEKQSHKCSSRYLGSRFYNIEEHSCCRKRKTPWDRGWQNCC